MEQIFKGVLFLETLIFGIGSIVFFYQVHKGMKGVKGRKIMYCSGIVVVFMDIFLDMLQAHSQSKDTWTIISDILLVVVFIWLAYYSGKILVWGVKEDKDEENF